MKLTKGKLSKIYNKKKQTMRKFKQKCKKSTRRKTFRKKRPLNLNRKTLKNIEQIQMMTMSGGDYQSPNYSIPVADRTVVDSTKQMQEQLEKLAGRRNSDNGYHVDDGSTLTAPLLKEEKYTVI